MMGEWEKEGDYSVFDDRELSESLLEDISLTDEIEEEIPLEDFYNDGEIDFEEPLYDNDFEEEIDIPVDETEHEEILEELPPLIDWVGYNKEEDDAMRRKAEAIMSEEEAAEHTIFFRPNKRQWNFVEEQAKTLGIRPYEYISQLIDRAIWIEESTSEVREKNEKK